jgi:hypothetical protein
MRFWEIDNKLEPIENFHDKIEKYYSWFFAGAALVEYILTGKSSAMKLAQQTCAGKTIIPIENIFTFGL